jgi:hypothetical protein
MKPSGKYATRDEDNIVTLYAGLAAQRLLNPSASNDNAIHDDEAVEDILPMLPRQDFDALKDFARRQRWLSERTSKPSKRLPRP